MSCSKVRPKEMTGVVAYIGTFVNKGICLQQCAKAARWAEVAWVRRTIERVGTCLDTSHRVSRCNYCSIVNIAWLGIDCFIESSI